MLLQSGLPAIFCHAAGSVTEYAPKHGGGMESIMNEKKPNIFVRAAKKISNYFRELKSELKKVVWPTKKQVRNNTGVVLTAIIIVGAFVALLDFGFQFLVNTLLK